MLRVQTVWNGVGTVGYTTHHFGSSDTADAPEAHARVVALWQGSSNTRIASVQAVVQSEVQVVEPTTGEVTGAIAVDPVTVAGTAANQERVGDALQVLCRLRTADYRRGRRVRGRFFVPGTAAQFQAGGNFGSTGPAQVGAALATFIVPGGNPVLPLVVWSRPFRVDENTVALGGSSVVTEASVWTEFAVLRSRRD